MSHATAQAVRQESSANACARHTQFARGLRVCVDTRRHEDVRKARASDTGQLHGSRGRCPRAREVRDRVPNATAALCLSVVCPAHGASLPRSNREEDTSRGGTRGAARQHVASASFLARGVSRVRLDRPAIPTTRTTPPPDTCRFSSASARARGRHATARGAFLNFDTGAAVRCASNVRFFLILTGPSRDKTSRSPA